MSEKIKLILSLSISGSMLAVIIFGIKPLIRNKLSKSVQYYIWLVVLLRLILPFSFETSIMNNIFYKDNVTQATVAQGGVNSPAKAVDNVDIYINGEDVSDAETLTLSPALPKKIDLIALIKNNLIYIWLLGVFVAFSINIWGYARFIKHLTSGNRPGKDEEIELLRELLGNKNRVMLLRNKYAATPMLIGILKPAIIIPDIDFTNGQLKNILLHEIMHLRRFDIGVKWLTVIAASIHWFNPLMYFIKKEINKACELSCDECVIKSFRDEEKQDYGETLISMVAEHKYSIGILSTTMCEEKKTLKERLVSIMNHSKKSRLITIISATLIIIIVCTSVVLGAGVGFGNRKPPNIYIISEFQETKNAILGGYSWKNGREHIEADAEHPVNFEYKSENMVSVTSKEQLIISSQKLKSDKKYDFTIGNVEVFKNGELIQSGSIDHGINNGDLYLVAPKDSGEYIYSIWLDFKDRGKVNYGFVVRVDMVTYDLTEIEKYKTPYIGDSSKVGSIARLLPSPANYFKQQYISMETSAKPYKLTVFYEGLSETGVYGEGWPISPTSSVILPVLQKNALVLFYSIDNLEEVIFAFRNTPSQGELVTSKYDSKFLFSRESIGRIYGDQIFNLKDMNQLQDILNGRGAGINNEIDNLLDIIMSSPMEASNPGAYIAAHQMEYNSIVSLSNKALPYLMDILNGGDRGLKGNIAKIICEDIVEKLNNNSSTNDEIKNITREAQDAIDKWNSMMGYSRSEQVPLDPLPEFTEKEVASAREVVEKYYRAIAAKDDKAILATLHESSKSDNMVLYGEEKRTLMTIDYDSQDSKRRNFRPDDPDFTPDKVIIFKVSFNIEYPNAIGGPWNEGLYDNWSMILIRENENSPWYIYDQGY